MSWLKGMPKDPGLYHFRSLQTVDDDFVLPAFERRVGNAKFPPNVMLLWKDYHGVLQVAFFGTEIWQDPDHFTCEYQPVHPPTETVLQDKHMPGIGQRGVWHQTARVMEENGNHEEAAELDGLSEAALEWARDEGNLSKKARFLEYQIVNLRRMANQQKGSIFGGGGMDVKADELEKELNELRTIMAETTGMGPVVSNLENIAETLP